MKHHRIIPVPDAPAYISAAITIGLIRSIAYIAHGSGGPAAVWFIVAWTTVVAYLFAADLVGRQPNAR